MKDPVPDGLLGARFTAIRLQGRDAVAGSALTLQFPAEGTRVGVSAGCNSMGGTPLFDGDRFAVPRMISTMMACIEDGVMEQERWYGRWLTDGVSWTRRGGILTLTGDGVTVTFERTGDADQRPTAGSGTAGETQGGVTTAAPGPVVPPQPPLPGASAPIRPTMGGNVPIPPPTR